MQKQVLCSGVKFPYKHQLSDQILYLIHHIYYDIKYSRPIYAHSRKFDCTVIGGLINFASVFYEYTESELSVSCILNLVALFFFVFPKVSTRGLLFKDSVPRF